MDRDPPPAGGEIKRNRAADAGCRACYKCCFPGFHLSFAKLTELYLSSGATYWIASAIRTSWRRSPPYAPPVA